MDFFSAVLILVLYFIRPQDWVPGLAGANLMQPVALFAILAAVTRTRTRTFVWRDLLSGPIDWLVLAYGAYIVATSSAPMGAAKEVFPLMVFYGVTRLAIDSKERLWRYLCCWAIMLVVIALFGVGAQFGVDVTGAEAMTEKFGGRLALGTWIHNNPNSLGHSTILALPLLYLAWFWRSTWARRLVVVLAMAVVCYGIFLTKSRGSFVAGLVVATFALSLGRPKMVQIGLCALVALSATSILAMLPRMEGMGALRSDEGVQGRMLAWEIARNAAESQAYGDGWKEFEAYIEYEGEMHPKATHSCYVRVAADLGYPGLFLYLGILWCCARALFHLRFAGREDEGLERSRRMLFALLAGYVISGWMIDRSYHMEFFLMAAAVAAAYKVAILDQNEDEEVLEDEEADVASLWTRFGVLDAGMAYALVLATFGVWDYIMGLV